MYLHQFSHWRIRQQRKGRKTLLCEREARLRLRHQRELRVNETVSEGTAVLQPTQEALPREPGSTGCLQSLIPYSLIIYVPFKGLPAVANWKMSYILPQLENVLSFCSRIISILQNVQPVCYNPMDQPIRSQTREGSFNPAFLRMYGREYKLVPPALENIYDIW